MAEKLTLRTNAAGDIYVYMEDTNSDSMAVGSDNVNGVFALNVATTPNVIPDEATASMAIEPGANGNITFRPHGTGGTFFDTGNVQISDGSLYLTTTSNDGAKGCVFSDITNLGAYTRVISFPDDYNIYIGSETGTFPNVVGVTYNIAIGNQGCFNSLTAGTTRNIAIGLSSMQRFTGNALGTSGNNVAIGSNTLYNLASGNNNLCLGNGSGFNLSGSDSSNVCISNSGTSGDNGTIRIGTSAIQTRAFLAGAYGVTPPAATPQIMVMDTAGQLGTTSGGSFTTNTYNTDAGSATPSAGALTIAGGSNIGTTGSGSTVTVDLDSTVNITGDFITTAGSVYVGTATPANPYDISIEGSVDGLVGQSIQNTSAGTSAGVNLQLIVEPATADAFVGYFVNGGGSWSAGLDNSDSDRFKISTGSSPSAGTAVLTLDSSGTVTSAAGITATTGNVTATTGNLVATSGLVAMPVTDTGITEGAITLGGTRFIHARGTDSVYIGQNSGNTTFTISGSENNVAVGANTLDAITTNARNNVAIGMNAMTAATDARGNTAVGFGSMRLMTTQLSNTAVGQNTLDKITSGDGRNSVLGNAAGVNLVTGSYNVIIGHNSGSNLTTSDSSNVIISTIATTGDNNTIRIGAQGTANGQQNRAFMAGIYNTTPAGGNDGMVYIDSNGQMGSQVNLVMPENPAFLAFLPSSVTNVTGNGTQFTIGTTTALTEVYDQGSNFNTNGTFTAPVTGKYQFSVTALISDCTIASTYLIRIITSNRTYAFETARAADAANFGATATVLADMDATDTMTCTVEVSGEAGDTNTLFGSATPTTFISGSLIS